MTRPAVSYRGPDASGRYQGLYALPGDADWRTVKDTAGALSTFATSSEAEAAAAHVLCAGLFKADAA